MATLPIEVEIKDRDKKLGSGIFGMIFVKRFIRRKVL
jgi:hypothetical protein